MSNKYIEKFFLLTEQNILASEFSTDKVARKDAKLSKNNRYFKYLFGILIIGLIYFFVHNDSRKSVLNDIIFAKTNKTNVVVMAEEPVLTSIIPSFRMAAHRRFLQQVYLKKMDVDFPNSTDLNKDYMQQAYVMDKVLVVPKYFG